MARDLVIRYLAYAVMLTVVGAGLAGALEREATAGAASGQDARAEYPSVTRQGLKPSMVVEVRNDETRDRVPSLTLSTEYLEGLQVAGVTPDPEEAEAVGEGMVRYAFTPLAPGDRLRAVLAFSIDQQSPGLRLSSPLIVALGPRVLIDTRIRTTVLP